MTEYRMVFPVSPALLEFRGPDAVRFLNGQVTQDVRRLAGGVISLPSCVTDAKGKLQFRITMTEVDGGILWVAGEVETRQALEARLTRYLIADDVEVADLTGNYFLTHFIGKAPPPPRLVIAREANRYGIPGTDWWSPAELDIECSEHQLMSSDELEFLRIKNRVPVWGRELMEGMLPPEALLETTDISYNKGCYIGQEVISRMKSAGKVNRRLTRFILNGDAPVLPGPLFDSKGMAAGELTSVSPLVTDNIRYALGYLKRGAEEAFFQSTDGTAYQVVVTGDES